MSVQDGQVISRVNWKSSQESENKFRDTVLRLREMKDGPWSFSSERAPESFFKVICRTKSRSMVCKDLLIKVSNS